MPLFPFQTNKATMDARIVKLKEFPAHSDRVTSIALGQETGDMLVTGGSDKKVNLWSLEKPNCITSFLGHTTPISCVRFSISEDQVCAGSQSGNIKIWDLGSLKTSKALMGHRATIKCIEFHSCSNLLISGSTDSVIKFWDVRRKGAVLSYKGHNSAVNALKFSPNGRWFASGGEDGRIKIWEIRKGQILHEFSDSSSPVTALTFHPKNAYLATSSLDQAVKYVDLESFKQTFVGTDGVNRCLLASCNNNCIYGATNDLMSVYEWNSHTIHDFIPTFTPKIQDLAISNNTLVGVSTKLSTVSVFSVDMKKLKPYYNQLQDPFSAGDSVNCVNQGCKTTDQVCNLKVQPVKLPSPENMKSVDADHPSSERTQEIFCPLKSLPRTPRTFRVDKSANQSHPTEVSQSSTEESFLKVNQEVPEKTKASTSVLPVTIIDLGDTIKQIPSNANGVIKERKPVNPITIPSTDKSNNHGCKILPTPFINQTQKSIPPMGASNEPLNPTLTTVPSTVLHPDTCTLTNCETRSSNQIPVTAESQIFSINHDIAPSTSDYDITSALKKNHQPVLHALQSRRQNLRQLYEAWRNKDLKKTAEMAVKFNDLTDLADFLGILTACRPSKWTLDVCVILLPALVKLIQSRHDTHNLAGCRGLCSMLRNFASVIRTNVASPIETLGVDLTQEERYNKSLLCHQHLLIIKQYLTDRTLRGSVGQASKEVQGLLSWLELES